LNKRDGVVGDFADECRLLGRRSMVNAALQDAASMSMSSNCYAIISNGIINKLYGLATITYFCKEFN
jgi:hypothetical protein